MNYFMILYILGWVVNISSVCLALPVAVGVFYNENQWKMYALVLAVSALLGFVLTRKKPRSTRYFAKDGFVTVALSWIVLSFIGAMPLYLTGEIPAFIDALFESVSGFTTTGASILTDVEALSHCSLFWRSFTHWIGGMGVLVFLLAIVPLSGGGSSMLLMKAESPGPSVSKLVPRIRQTAFILYTIYFAMTVIESIFLLLGGMPWFDAIATAFGTAGTGGFAIRRESMGFYNSFYLQGVVTVFMLLFSVNFSVYYLMLTKKFKQAFKSEELRWFLATVAFSTLVITIALCRQSPDGSVYYNFHHSIFAVSSIISTTGFGTVDFNQWPQIAKFILFILMFVGACAGSTGGGIKVSRIILLIKSSIREIVSVVHPNSVRVVKLDKKRIDHETLKGTTAFFVLAMLIFVASVFLISLDGFDMTTSLTSVAATMNNIGPGLELVGPAGNYSGFSLLSKLVLIFDMLAGRLEYFPMLVLFSPVTWKNGFLAVGRKIHRRKEYT